MKLLTILALSAFTFAAVAPADAADFSPALQEVIAGAKKENKLELQWGSGMIGNNNVLNNRLFGNVFAELDLLKDFTDLLIKETLIRSSLNCQ